MSALRDAIGLRGYAQKDPKQEYKREGYDIFVEMLNRTKSNVASQIFRVKVQREEDVGIQPVLQAPKKVQEIAPAETAQQVATESADTPAEALPTKVTTVVREEPKLRRNDPCWCGSGKKYKQCHWRKDTQGQANP
ncbi:MAG: hypothetical protein CO108_11000 [Deltaproteobacteria bacterium CG_4_9_14_3_um_filter_63_12]|nr:MAG: hypothetical protein CO108_11000 [Deltaproteobacteria bacterium CG_4_9_14_3_um_filter_63_12]